MANPQELEALLLGWLEDATNMKVGLTDDDSDIDLTYITEKLRKLSVYQERLSDIMMKITRMSLDIHTASRSLIAAVILREKELKASDAYSEVARNERAFWLANQLADDKQATEEWKSLSTMVSTVKEAVAERAATMKRLDSDIRLHARLFEAGVAGGAKSPSSYTGGSTKEMDLA